MISNNSQIINDQRIYDFESAIIFWIGSSVMSLILAASLWKTKVNN